MSKPDSTDEYINIEGEVIESGQRKLWRQGDSIAVTLPMNSTRKQAKIRGVGLWDFLGSKVRFKVIKPFSKSSFFGKLIIIVDWPDREGEEE